MAEKKDKKKMNELDELSLDELIEKCKQIKELLANLENQYRSAAITEQSYKQAKEANTKKLNEVKKRLEEWGVKDEDTPAPAAASSEKPAASPPAAPIPAPSTAASATAKNAPSEIKQTPSAPPLPAAATIIHAPVDEEIPANEPVPSAPLSFAQKIKQQFISPSARQEAESAYSPQAQAAIAQTVQLELQKFQEKFNVELERIKAAMDAIKETRASTDERLQMLTEGLAELRSNVFQREAGIKEQEMKLVRLKESIDEIEPQKISKEFSKRDKTSSEAEIRIEKLEVKSGDAIKSIGEINALLKSIGGLENVADIDHDVSKKLEKVQELNKATERLSSKIEKMFVEMNRRLEKFSIYEARQDNMNEILNDMIRNFDALSVKFEAYAEKREITTLKEDFAEMQKKLEIMKKILNKAVPFAEAEIPEELQSIMAEKEDVESLLSSVEYEHEKKQISDAEYGPIKEKNEARLKEIKQKISDAMKRAQPPADAAPKPPAEKKVQLVDAMLSDMEKQKAAAKKEGAKEPAENDETENATDENATEIDEPEKSAALTKEGDVPETQNEAVAQKTSEPIKAPKQKKNNSAAAEQKNSGAINGASNGADASKAQKNGRKSMRASQGLFVPATSISDVNGMISSGNGKAAEPEKQNIPANIEKADTPKNAEKPADLKKESTPETEAKKSAEKKSGAKAEEENPLLKELGESLKEGLINEETYENTKKLLMMG